MTVGDAHVPCAGVYTAVPVLIGDERFSIDFFVIGLEDTRWSWAATGCAP